MGTDKTQLIERLLRLPDAALPELASYMAYLEYKTGNRADAGQSDGFELPGTESKKPFKYDVPDESEMQQQIDEWEDESKLF